MTLVETRERNVAQTPAERNPQRESKPKLSLRRRLKLDLKEKRAAFNEALDQLITDEGERQSSWQRVKDYFRLRSKKPSR